jgi:hypothetical protein
VSHLIGNFENLTPEQADELRRRIASEGLPITLEKKPMSHPSHRRTRLRLMLEKIDDAFGTTVEKAETLSPEDRREYEVRRNTAMYVYSHDLTEEEARAAAVRHVDWAARLETEEGRAAETTRVPWKTAGDSAAVARTLGAQAAITIETWPLGIIVRAPGGAPLDTLSMATEYAKKRYRLRNGEEDRLDMDTGLASAFGALFVIGLRDDLVEWRRKVEAMLPPTLEGWLAGTDIGKSSRVIALTLLGRPVETALPYDDADFGRCFRLVTRFGLESRLPEVAAAHPAWAPLVEAWAELVSLYEVLLDLRSAIDLRSAKVPEPVKGKRAAKAKAEADVKALDERRKVAYDAFRDRLRELRGGGW